LRERERESATDANLGSSGGSETAKAADTGTRASHGAQLVQEHVMRHIVESFRKIKISVIIITVIIIIIMQKYPWA
jgi:hypothetical protein